MDDKKRPVGRKKNVIEGTSHVGRREGSGPVSGGPASKPATGSTGNTGSAHSYTYGGQANVPHTGNTPVRPTSYTSGGTGGASRQTRGGSSPLLMIIIIAAIVLIGGGGGLGSLTGLFGGGDMGSVTDLLGGDSSYSMPAYSAPESTVVSEPASSEPVNTAVAKTARKKRVVLKGSGQDSTTILVYMCGTDLESKGGYATKDMQEMAAAKLGGKVNLYVYTGGCKSWKNSVVSTSKNQIYSIHDGGLELMWESDRLQPMTDPSTLSSFIQWGMKNAPADRYELIFWDHGGGSVSGYGYDEVYPNSGSMTLDGIATALKDGGCTFDFIGFDACLMATLETAIVVEPYADYLIGSEETEPGCGWYYTDWLNNLSKQPSRTALDMGKDIADSFVNVCGQLCPKQQATLSVIDLAELSGTVPQSFQAFALSTAKSIKENNYQSVASARANTKEFAQSTNIDQVDLIHLANNMNTAESKQLAKALKGAVKYNATSSNISNANGVSIYFPYGRMNSVNKMAQTYEKIGLDSAYTDCIKEFASVEVAGQSAFGGSANQLESLFSALMGGGAPASTTSSGSLGGLGGLSGFTGSGSATGSMVAELLGTLLTGRSLPEVGLDEETAEFLDRDIIENSADYIAANQLDISEFAWITKDGEKVLELSEDQWALVQSVELNVFVDDGEGYVDLGLDNTFEFNDDGDLIGQYDGTWLSVNGQIVAYYMMSSEGDSDDYKIMGRIPVFYNGQRADLIACFTDEVPEGEILGAAIRYEGETETVARGLAEIAEGDRIDFICDYYDYDRNYQNSYFLGDTLIVGKELKLGDIRMDNDNYIAAYRLTDIYNNKFWTPSMN